MEKLTVGIATIGVIATSVFGIQSAEATSNHDRLSGVVDATWLHVREEPSNKSDIEKSLKQGTPVQIHEQKNGWYRIDGGWVSADFVKVTSNLFNYELRSEKSLGTTTSNLNMRATNSTSGKIITTLKTGTAVEIISEKSGWYQVKAAGKTGWVSAEFVKVTSVPKPKPEPQPEVTKKAGTTTSNLNMRATNSTSGKIITTLKTGTSVEIIG
ncbi:SH3 domain-containing protein, partial [Priestia taiwanensis]